MSTRPTGNFGSTPFPQVLVYLRRRRMSGTMIVHGLDGGDGKVHFLDGNPACIEIKTSAQRLGELLVIRGLINAKTLASALREMKERGVRLGRYLLDEGLVGKDEFGQVMEFQLDRRLALLYPLAGEDFTFHDGQNLTNFDENDMYAVDAVRSMPRHLRETWDLTRLEIQLARLEGHGLRLRADVDGEPDWSEEESQLVAAMDGRTLLLDALTQMGAGREPCMQLVLYVLMLAGGVELVDESQAEGSGPPAEAAPPPPPEPEDPRLAELRARARAKMDQIKAGNCFEMLEVDEAADVEAIRSAYLGLVKTFHPDAASSIDDEKVRESYVYISTHLREAFDMLTDPEKRQAHIASLRGGPSNEEEKAIVQQALNAELTFQKASILARKRKWDEAATLMRAVVKVAPDNGDYLALLAWCQASLAPAGADLTEQEAGLRQATALSPRSEKAHYYLAQVLKRSGKDREARTCLQTVVALNPHNIDAKRELRILEMRKEQPERPSRLSLGLGRKEDGGDKPDPGEGTFGKLKKILTKKL